MQKSLLFVLIAGLATLMGCGSGGSDTTDTTSDSTTAATPAAPTKPASTVTGVEISYAYEGVTMNGYMAYDESTIDPRPGILVVHEWWGHNAYARWRAEKLAELGYVALVVDMYGDGKQANHPEDAQAFSSAVFADLDNAEGRFMEALKILQSSELVQEDKIGAIGYCFGGGIALAMASRGVDLDAVVSFHGMLPVIPAEPGTITADILVCNGADDNFVPAESIEAFKANMEAAEADYTFINYPGALHSFTSKEADSIAVAFDLPIAYNAGADQGSWAEMINHFNEAFGN